MTKQDILNRIKMPEQAAAQIAATDALISAAPRAADELADIKKRFFDGEDVNGALERLSAALGCTKDALALAFCLECTDVTERLMRGQGFGEEDFIANLLDLTIWAKVCHRDWGGWGMHEFDWVAKALRAKLWRLGRLQFELEKFTCDSYERRGVCVRRGDPVINTHIPEGGSISDAERLASYRRAYDYFGFGVFVCESYLLYPAQYDFLDPESNIVHFMNEFDIIEHGEDTQMKDMWRIFGVREDWDPAKLPRDTRLQRAYADHIARTGKNGWGYGIMIFDGEKPVR